MNGKINNFLIIMFALLTLSSFVFPNIIYPITIGVLIISILSFIISIVIYYLICFGWYIEIDVIVCMLNSIYSFVLSIVPIWICLSFKMFINNDFAVYISLLGMFIYYRVIIIYSIAFTKNNKSFDNTEIISKLALNILRFIMLVLTSIDKHDILMLNINAVVNDVIIASIVFDTIVVVLIDYNKLRKKQRIEMWSKLS